MRLFLFAREAKATGQFGVRSAIQRLNRFLAEIVTADGASTHGPNWYLGGPPELSVAGGRCVTGGLIENQPRAQAGRLSYVGKNGVALHYFTGQR